MISAISGEMAWTARCRSLAPRPADAAAPLGAMASGADREGGPDAPLDNDAVTLMLFNDDG